MTSSARSSRFAPVLLSVSALLAACTNDGGGEPPNPVDAVLLPELEAAGYVPALASERELCTRLHVDLLGVRPGRGELEATCLGRDVGGAVRDMQRTKAYRHTQRRLWADRLQYSDFFVDVESLRALDGLVDDLYRERIGYERFAEVVLAHPGFAGRHVSYGQPALVAEAAFRAFLGRPATAPERLDLAPLWKPWLGQFFLVDGLEESSFSYGYGSAPMIDPFACEAGVQSCTSSLLGDASLEFPRAGREGPIAMDDLTAEDWFALREPGRLVTSQHMFWEAQVDEVLERYLGYDLGALRPQVRQDLVEYFRSTGGNVRRLEWMVLTSIAYRQTSEAQPPRPESLRFEPFAYGPVKPMIAETFLASVGRLAGQDAGNCDWRYPNLPEWYYPGVPALDEALDDLYPRNADGTIDTWFRDLAIQMGGCPGTTDWNSFLPRTRSNHVGLMAAVAQEEAIVELCFLRDVGALLPDGVPARSVRADAKARVAEHLLARATGGATGAEIDEIVAAADAGCDTCTAEALARDLCASLAGGAEFLFY